MELIYWPFLQMLSWGFLQKYLASTENPYAQAAGVLIGSVLLWDILFRSKIGFSTTFIEEMWSRNLGNLLISPLRPFELVAALSVWSIIRLSVGMVPVSIAAFLFFGFNLLGARVSDVVLGILSVADHRRRYAAYDDVVGSVLDDGCIARDQNAASDCDAGPDDAGEARARVCR